MVSEATFSILPCYASWCCDGSMLVSPKYAWYPGVNWTGKTDTARHCGAVLQGGPRSSSVLYCTVLYCMVVLAGSSDASLTLCYTRDVTIYIHWQCIGILSEPIRLFSLVPSRPSSHWYVIVPVLMCILIVWGSRLKITHRCDQLVTSISNQCLIELSNEIFIKISTICREDPD